jgi:signal transduction histidine kinase/DNA-binding LacI/PurR family transcriptional regulator
VRVGFFLRNLDEEYQINVFRGIRNQARVRGVDLVCVQGETVRSNDDLQPFVLADEVSFDGLLILAPVIIDHSDSSVALRLPRMLPPVPCISVGLKIPGMASLTIQSVRSLTRVLEHLILDHGYRRFLYVGGPAAHRDNQVRERVFVKTMKEFSTLWPELSWTVDHGGFFEASGVEVIRRYLDGPPFDAVVAANDNMALGVLRVLKMQDDPAWRSCAVTGFDDIPQAADEDPPLTSVHQPLDSLGAVALDMLVDRLSGVPVPQTRSISSRPVIRESCGCRAPDAGAQPGAWVDRRVLESHLAGIRRQAFEAEVRLREGGWFARDMSAVSTMEGLTSRLDEFTALLGVQDFYLLSGGRLQYERRRNQRTELPPEGLPMTAEQLFTGRTGLAPWALSVSHLRSGSENLGLVIYSVEDRSLPYLAAGLPNLAHAVMRLKTLAEQAEHARYQLLQLILRTLPIPLAVFDRGDGGILYSNRAFDEAVGGPSGSRPITDYLDLPDVCEGVELSLNPGVPGPPVPVLVSTARLAFEGREAAMAAMVDLSRQKTLEAEVLRISEFERRRIGLDLHDDICQRLAGLTMYLKGFAKRPPADPAAAMAEVAAMVDQTLHLTRQYAHASFPIDLERHGLDSVLRTLCETVSVQNGCPCLYDSQLGSLSEPIAGAQALNVYRIVQEALQNAVKHSRASRIEVTVEVGAGAVILQIADNGRGMHRAEGGLGFRSMAYRASQLGARFDLSTRRDIGTVVLVEIPAASLRPAETTESSSR